MRAAFDLLLAEQRKPALDQIEPRGGSRREVQMKPRVAREPPPHARRLVRAVVVQDQMDVEVRRHLGIDRVEELQELLTPMTPMPFADDLARGDVERGEQCGRAVAHIIMRAPLGKPNDSGSNGAVRSSA